MNPMRNNDWFSEDSVTAVFGVLPNLLEFHRDFLKRLLAAQAIALSKGVFTAVADCFLIHQQRFHYYTHYCTNFPR